MYFLMNHARQRSTSRDGKNMIVAGNNSTEVPSYNVHREWVMARILQPHGIPPGKPGSISIKRNAIMCCGRFEFDRGESNARVVR